MTVLLVDDQPINLRLLKAIIEAEGYQVLEAVDGIDALAILRSNSVDAVISDILMPRMDGYRLCSEIRQDPAISKVQFIFYTATYNSPANEKLCYDLGADQYLRKPAPAAELLAALASGTAHRPAAHLKSLVENQVMKQYNEQLVLKLEEKNHELMESLARLDLTNRALSAAANAILITKSDGIIEWVNPAFSEISGYSLEEAIGKKPGELLKSGRHDKPFYEQLWRTIRSGKIWHGELFNRKKDGTVYPEDMTITPVMNESSQITHFIAVKQDISDRVAAHEALRLESERFRQIAEAIREVFYLIHPQMTKMYYISPAYEEIWGHSCESVYANPTSWADAIHPDDRDRVFKEIAPEGTLIPIDVEFRIIRSDGEIRFIRANTSPIYNETGAVYRFAGTAEDITQQRQTELQLRQSQKMEAIGQLSGGVAHDFNNLLTVILGHANLLAEHMPDGEATDSISEICRAGERAANLTRQLLLFARKQVMQMKSLDINSVIADTIKMLTRILGEDIQLDFRPVHGEVTVQADAGMLDQILLNLAVNARDAMPKGGRLGIETARVKFDTETATQSAQIRAGTFAIISVSDSGSGIPTDVLPKIFEPFFTTKDANKGTGLGLATVFGIVQQHSGWINVYSEEGLGTTFRIYLPLISGTLSATEETKIAREVIEGNETILFVEDDQAIRMMTSKYLGKLGYNVITAGNGPEAVKIFMTREKEISLVFSDLVMPGGINGANLCRILRQKKSNLKIIFASGYSDMMLAGEIKLTEGLNFLAKPFSLASVAKIIRSQLDMKSA
jgi:two-component system, cell cycle sensor histidine kinase and response regulator CckA